MLLLLPTLDYIGTRIVNHVQNAVATVAKVAITPIVISTLPDDSVVKTAMVHLADRKKSELM